MASYRKIYGLILFNALFAGAIPASAASEPRHVVVIVWDGMRPDFVTEDKTPTLWKLAQSGVTFRNHHSVYPSATNVNGTALATGVFPGHSGILANHVYRADINANESIDVEAAKVVRKGDELSNGKYLSVPTVAELVHQSGGRTVIATAKTIGLLLDRHVDVAGKGSTTLFQGDALPEPIGAQLLKALGPFPSMKKPDYAFAKADAWTIKALIDFLWKPDVPMFSVLWLSEPDGSQHLHAPGSPEALRALKSADENLARVLAELDRQRVRETTDIFVVSDHGFSTISRQIDLPKILKDAGFRVSDDKFKSKPERGEILMVGNGGSVLFYVVGNDADVTRKLVEFLQQSDFAGVIFTRDRLEGTFSFDEGKIGNDTEPDVMMSFRWSNAASQFGVPGMIDADWQRKAGEGTHATLSRYDMHNTLIAAGPDFQKAVTNDYPTGNVDLAPTIVKIFGLGAVPMDGRVLSEAMIGGNSDVQVETGEMKATKEFGERKWLQRLKTSRVGSTIYFDEGNGNFGSKR